VTPPKEAAPAARPEPQKAEAKPVVGKPEQPKADAKADAPQQRSRSVIV